MSVWTSGVTGGASRKWTEANAAASTANSAATLHAARPNRDFFKGAAGTALPDSGALAIHSNSALQVARRLPAIVRIFRQATLQHSIQRRRRDIRISKARDVP